MDSWVLLGTLTVKSLWFGELFGSKGCQWPGEPGLGALSGPAWPRRPCRPRPPSPVGCRPRPVSPGPAPGLAWAPAWPGLTPKPLKILWFLKLSEPEG